MLGEGDLTSTADYCSMASLWNSSHGENVQTRKVKSVLLTGHLVVLAWYSIYRVRKTIRGFSHKRAQTIWSAYLEILCTLDFTWLPLSSSLMQNKPILRTVTAQNASNRQFWHHNYSIPWQPPHPSSFYSNNYAGGILYASLLATSRMGLYKPIQRNSRTPLELDTFFLTLSRHRSSFWPHIGYYHLHFQQNIWLGNLFYYICWGFPQAIFLGYLLGFLVKNVLLWKLPTSYWWTIWHIFFIRKL